MDRGRKTTRYHLVIPGTSQRRARGVQPHSCAISGAPVRPYCRFRPAAPDGISPRFPAALHRPAALCAWSTGVLHSITAFCYRYPNRKSVLCQVRLSNISAARCSVVGVMRAPPMMRASSALRPSQASGVTLVNVRPSCSALAMRKCVSASAAICGSCVTHWTCFVRDRARSFSATR